ncbi:MAG: ChaN family lipoprotein [Bacteroidota bacterium]|nr:ChaN family lipoprotein [Bacteroidota bacterium]
MLRTKTILLTIILFVGLTAFKSDKPSHQLYKASGKNIKFKKLIKEAAQADIILFGELHNNPIAHWMQYEIVKEMYAEKGKQIVLGAEMFEADNQTIIDEYLGGLIKQKDFEKEARLWTNYQTDYKPLFEFAKDSSLKFIATNIPRRYAALVHKQGFEGLEKLSATAKQWVAPLPIAYDPELPGYKKMANMMKKMGRGKMANNNLPKAQASKDATMAHFILENWEQGKQFIHFNGSYHSDNFEAIGWYLKQVNPELKIITISTVEQDEVGDLENEYKNIADFIIAVDSDMTKTY